VRQTGYLVHTANAIELLEKASPEAAAWWKENRPDLATGTQQFLFATEGCRVVGSESLDAPEEGLSASRRTEKTVAIPFAFTRPNYLDQVSSFEKTLAIVALVLATPVFFVGLVLAIAVSIAQFPGPGIGSGIACVLIFGVLTFGSSFILLRLLSGEKAANGRTLLPEWFIQGFGVLFIAAVCGTAWMGHWMLVGGCLSVGLAMIGIRRLIRASGPPQSQ
jgi:hypothetical protein